MGLKKIFFIKMFKRRKIGDVTMLAQFCEIVDDLINDNFEFVINQIKFWNLISFIGGNIHIDQLAKSNKPQIFNSPKPCMKQLFQRYIDAGNLYITRINLDTLNFFLLFKDFHLILWNNKIFHNEFTTYLTTLAPNNNNYDNYERSYLIKMADQILIMFERLLEKNDENNQKLYKMKSTLKNTKNHPEICDYYNENFKVNNSYIDCEDSPDDFYGD